VNYHAQLIEAFRQNIAFYEGQLGFRPTRIRTNIPIGNGDIDILLECGGKNAIIEVKAHEGLLQKFKDSQLRKYRSYLPTADIYSFTGDLSKTLDPSRLQLRKH
jgi:hypothetical protein